MFIEKIQLLPNSLKRKNLYYRPSMIINSKSINSYPSDNPSSAAHPHFTKGSKGHVPSPVCFYTLCA